MTLPVESMSLARFSAEYCRRHGRLLLSRRDVGRMSVPISRLSKEDFPAEISPINNITMIINRLIEQFLLGVHAFQFSIHVGIRISIGPVLGIILFAFSVFFCLSCFFFFVFWGFYCFIFSIVSFCFFTIVVFLVFSVLFWFVEFNFLIFCFCL